MDNEVKGEGNHYTTEFRQLDPRLGRWFSVDPKTAMQPWFTPYSSMNNNPITFNDPHGDIEPLVIWALKKLGEGAIYVTADVAVQFSMHYMFGDYESVDEAWEAFDIDWYEAIASGGEAFIPGGKKAQLAYQVGVSMVDYIFEEDEWTGAGFMAAAMEGAIVELVGTNATKLIEKYGADAVAKGLKKMDAPLGFIYEITGLGFGKFSKGTTEQYRRGKEIISKYRKNNGLTSNRKMQKNLGYAEGRVGNKSYSAEGTMTMSNDQYSRTKIFESKDVGGWDRWTDSEYQILNDIALDNGATSLRDVFPEVTGSITLVTERPACDSCKDVIIEQFMNMFPNVDVTLVNGAKNID